MKKNDYDLLKNKVSNLEDVNNALLCVIHICFKQLFSEKNYPSVIDYLDNLEKNNQIDEKTRQNIINLFKLI